MRYDVNKYGKSSDTVLFKKFRKLHPELWRYGITYGLCDIMTLRIWIPKLGVIRYNAIFDKIDWEQYWEDPDRIKQEEREKRPDMYQRLLSEIDIYRKETGVTQGQLAELTGLSRKSINEYLSGTSMPKVSTMRKIADALGIDI